MRIIKKQNRIEKERKMICHKCKTKFAYTQKDVESDRDGKYVVCPNKDCAAFIGVENPPITI